MNDALKMQISAFVDGELPDQEAELLMRRLSQDGTLRRQAARYLEIGRLIRGEKHLPGVRQLRERISASLAGEVPPTHLAPERAGGRYLRPAAGLAIAASVAVLALVGLRQVNQPVETVVNAAPAPTGVVDRASYTEPAVGEILADRPSEMLMQYYLSHGATSGDLGANGILTRLVTLELRGGELVEVSSDDNELADDAVENDNVATVPSDSE
jgi:anti-sigma factor RsiW